MKKFKSRSGKWFSFHIEKARILTNFDIDSFKDHKVLKILYNAGFCHAKLPHPLSSNVRVRNLSIALRFRYFYLKHYH